MMLKKGNRVRVAQCECACHCNWPWRQLPIGVVTKVDTAGFRQWITVRFGLPWLGMYLRHFDSQWFSLVEEE
jgi:hypothetical protein